MILYEVEELQQKISVLRENSQWPGGLLEFWGLDMFKDSNSVLLHAR